MGGGIGTDLQSDKTITDGPGKWDLLAALGDRYLGRYIKLTVVTVSKEEEFEVLVDSLQHEDGSGESWIVELKAKWNGGRFRGHYSTKTRKGFLRKITK
ncbi:hypothetical protein IT407_01605 [Candidatus Uhrbacteria bacterium]|nr:hypothetical protein [Candidatus Uhrbacteria bacterium]